MDTTKKQAATIQRLAPRRPYNPPRLVTHGTVNQCNNAVAPLRPYHSVEVVDGTFSGVTLFEEINSGLQQ